MGDFATSADGRYLAARARSAALLEQWRSEDVEACEALWERPVVSAETARGER